MPLTGQRYPDTFLIEILGQLGFNSALNASHHPLYDPTGRNKDYFSLAQISGQNVTLEGGESGNGAVLRLSASTAWMNAKYVLVFERNQDLRTTFGYVLTQVTKRDQTSQQQETLHAGTDFTPSPLLTGRAVSFLRNMAQTMQRLPNAMPASAQTDFLNALDSARIKKKNATPAITHDNQQPVLAPTFSTANPTPKQIREALFSGVGKKPVHMEEGGYASGPLYDRPPESTPSGTAPAAQGRRQPMDLIRENRPTPQHP